MKTERELRIIKEATGLFYRHGFKRVTMNDIAEAVGISRPALYLLFANKEQIFEAVIRHRGAETVAAIVAAVDRQIGVRNKLLAVFELWCVAPFEVLLQYPDARDLIECGHGFASAALDELIREVAGVVERELTCAFPGSEKVPMVTRVLMASLGGFKQVATDVEALRYLLASQIDMTLTALAAQPLTAQ